MGPTHPTPKVNAAKWSEMLSTAAQASKNWFHKYVVSTKEGGYGVKKKSEMGKQDEKLTLEDITAISLKAIQDIEANAITNIRKGKYNLTNETKEIQEIGSIVKNTITLIRAREAKKDRVTYQILRLFAIAFTGGKYYRDRQPKLDEFNADMQKKIDAVNRQYAGTLKKLDKIAQQQPLFLVLQKAFGDLPETFSALLSLDRGPIPDLIEELAQLAAVEKQTPDVQRNYQEKKNELAEYIEYIVKLSANNSLSLKDAAERVNAYVAMTNQLNGESTLPVQQYLQDEFDKEDNLYKNRTVGKDKTQFFKDYVRTDTFFLEDSKEGKVDGPIPSKSLEKTHNSEKFSLNPSQKDFLDELIKNQRLNEAMEAIHKITQVADGDSRWVSAIRTAVSQHSAVSFIGNFSIIQANSIAESTNFGAKTIRNLQPVKIKIIRENDKPFKIKSIQVSAKGSISLTDKSSDNIVDPNVVTGTINYNIELDQDDRAVIKDVKLKYESPLKSVEIE